MSHPINYRQLLNLLLLQHPSADYKPQKMAIPKNRNEAHQMFLSLMNEIIKEHLQPGQRFASELSGGLDSSTVSILVANQLQQAKQNLHCFGNVPHEGFEFPHSSKSSLDDRQFMQAVAHQAGNIALHYITPDQYDLTFDKAAAFCFHYHIPPVRNPLNLGWMSGIQKQARQLGANTLFTGATGNATFSWSGLDAHWHRRWYKLLRSEMGFYKRWLKIKLTRAAWWQEYCCANKIAINYFKPKISEVVLRSRYTQKTFVNLLLGINEQTQGFQRALAQHYGIRTVDLTSDKKLVDFCLQLPNHFYQQGRKSRLLVREGLKNILPDSVLNQTKLGLQNAAWFYELQALVPHYQTLLQEFKHIKIISKLIDLNAIEKRLNELKNCNPGQNQWYDLNTKFRYQLARSLHIAEWVFYHFDPQALPYDFKTIKANYCSLDSLHPHQILD